MPSAGRSGPGPRLQSLRRGLGSDELRATRSVAVLITCVQQNEHIWVGVVRARRWPPRGRAPGPVRRGGGGGMTSHC